MTLASLVLVSSETPSRRLHICGHEIKRVLNRICSYPTTMEHACKSIVFETKYTYKSFVQQYFPYFQLQFISKPVT